MHVPANLGRTVYNVGGTLHRFVPRGSFVRYGSTKANPVEPLVGTKLLAARFIVGLNVRGKPKWKVDDVVPIVVRVRHAQGYGAGATLLTQKGIFQASPDAPLDEENSVQIIVINYEGATEKRFKKDMHQLAEALRRELDQDTVLVEIQKSGRVIEAFAEVRG